MVIRRNRRFPIKFARFLGEVDLAPVRLINESCVQ